MDGTALKIPPQSKSGHQRILIFTSGLVILVVILGFGFWRYGFGKPIQTAPQAVPIPGFCQILEENYCKTAEFFDYTDPKDGQIYRLVGFRGLPAEKPLFSPMDGQAAWQDAHLEPQYTNPFQRVSSVSVSRKGDPNLTMYTFLGGLQTVASPGRSTIDVKEKEVVARVKPGEQILGYDMVVMITQWNGDKDNSKFYTPDDTLKGLFHSNKP
ncbi:MAG: hypothetical protein Q8P44_02565 [Dehalococcoidia bacterium]|nr:hypothetical protein [Dehalococcoidia bacterium]